MDPVELISLWTNVPMAAYRKHMRDRMAKIRLATGNA